MIQARVKATLADGFVELTRRDGATLPEVNVAGAGEYPNGAGDKSEAATARNLITLSDL